MLLGSGEGLEEGEEYDDVDFPGLLRESVGKELELREFFFNLFLVFALFCSVDWFLHYFALLYLIFFIQVNRVVIK